MHIRDLKKIKKQAETLEQEAMSLHAQALAKKTELQRSCHHPKQYLKVEESYFSGSYYDRASTTYTTVCTLCGARSESETKTHSWYG